MAIKIERKIVKYQVQKPEDKPADKAADKPAAKVPETRAAPQPGEPELVRDKNGRTATVIRMHEKLERPEVLVGSTYKIKTPISDHAMYVTINDIVLNEGTEYEQRRPFEIFINSKNLDHFQWIVALTRIISAVFRKGGDVTFLVDELKAVFDPRGGYWQPGGKFMPSIIAELGYVIEKLHRFRRIRLERVPRSGEGLHAHARQRGRGQRAAAREAARGDPAQAPPRHGLPRAGQHAHAAAHEVRLARGGAVRRGRDARDGGRRLEGGGARARARERPGADHERGVHGDEGDAAPTFQEMARDGWKPGARIAGRLLHAKYSRYMQRVAQAAPQLVHELAETGARFTHHTSIAPTGTISLSLANNASNGIEPSFAHHYFRNVIREGKKSKEKIDVYSFELLAYRELVNPQAKPGATNDAERLPDYFIASEDITPKEHVEVQAAAQKWVDSSISKTANVPTDFPYEKFKDIYLYAHEQGLKGCTTFRFNPEAFQGVLVKEQDLKNTTYKFTLEDGSVIEARGDEEIDYDGEIHTAANLFDAIKDGYYGRM